MAEIEKLQALAKGTPGNSTGEDVANAVNALIDQAEDQFNTASSTAFIDYTNASLFTNTTYSEKQIAISANGKPYVCILSCTATENSPQPEDDTVHWFTWQGVTFDRLNYVDFGLFGHKDAGGRVSYLFGTLPSEKIDNQEAFERCRDFAIAIVVKLYISPKGAGIST